MHGFAGGSLSGRFFVSGIASIASGRAAFDVRDGILAFLGEEHTEIALRLEGVPAVCLSQRFGVEHQQILRTCQSIKLKQSSRASRGDEPFV